MMPMNNPIMALVQAMQSGRNPANLLQMMARNNPQAEQAMRLIQGKNPNQLRKIAENMARERGTTIEDLARQMGISVPSDR